MSSQDELRQELEEAIENLHHAVDTLEQEDLEFAEMEALIAVRNASLKVKPAVNDLKKEVREELDESDLDLI